MYLFFIKYVLVLKIKIASSCEGSSTVVNYISDVEIFYISSLNIIISLGHITCLHSVTRFYISDKKLLQKIQHLTMVGQERYP